jgi:hypothetical protein
MKIPADDMNTKGSCDPRLVPRIAETGLNTKLGPAMPRPLVRATGGDAVSVGSNSARRRLAGLPGRFD